MAKEKDPAKVAAQEAVAEAKATLAVAKSGGAKDEIIAAVKNLESKIDRLCAILAAPAPALKDDDDLFGDDDPEEIEPDPQTEEDD